MQELVVTAMDNTGLEWGRLVGKGMANKYLQTVYWTWKRSEENQTIFEKYNVEEVSGHCP